MRPCFVVYKGYYMKKKFRGVLIIILLLFCIILAASIYGLIRYNSGIEAVDVQDTNKITVEIPSGSSAYSIIKILDEKGLINDPLVARLFVKFGEYDTLQANTYLFSKSMSIKEIFDAINAGSFEYIAKQQFTVIPGSTIPEAAKHLQDDLGIEAGEFLSLWSDKSYLDSLIDDYWFITTDIYDSEILYPLEGYLYPETYYITGEITPKSVTKLLLEFTDKKLSSLTEEMNDLGLSAHEFITLSSVVQSEALHDKDMPTIAGVFVNRLNKNMLLQSDSTVLYALQEKHINVTYSDLEVDSKYNTYKYAGLPVGPVCAPSGAAFEGTAAYENNDYLYFFACKDGTILYSKTLAEHNLAVKNNLWY